MRIRPFRGYRYDPAKAPDLSRVVAPPYDQIDADTRETLYALHPWNFVRVTLGRPEPGDTGDRDRHRRARRQLDRWIGEGVLIRDETPAVYLYLTTYRAGGETLGRLGVVVLGALSEYREGVVLPHERTHAGPKLERLRHLEATGADTGLLFMLVSDPAGDLRAALAPPEAPPVAEARDLGGERHQLWRITEPAAIGRIQALLAPRRLIIADGHHRYETALEYRRRHPGEDWKLMAVFPLEAPGLTIQPTHRLVRDLPGFDVDALLRGAGEWFEVEPAPPREDPAEEAGALTVALAARSGGGRLAVVVVAGAGAWLLTLRPSAFGAIPWPRGTSPAWRRLAVSVLHEALLKPRLGITDEILGRQAHVDYTADAALAVALVRKGDYQAGFLIPPTTPGELRAVVEAGELLPQKSTFFYPKLLDGLVFHRLGGEGA